MANAQGASMMLHDMTEGLLERRLHIAPCLPGRQCKPNFPLKILLGFGNNTMGSTVPFPNNNDSNKK